MSDYDFRLRNDRKLELSNKVAASIVNDIWEMSLTAKDAQEFVDFLMTITDQDTIEEFFNKCHDEGGRFCGGATGTGRGPGTHIPAPIDYVKQQVREKAKITGKRASSAPLSHVTTSPVRRLFDIVSGGLGFNPSGFGTVKIRRLQKANLSEFGTKDLKVLKTRLQASQRQYNNMNTMGWAMAAAAGGTAAGKGTRAASPFLAASAAYSIGLSRWKTRRIPAQIERVDRALAKRSKLSSDYIELALEDENLPTLAQEIAAAKKEIESKNFPKVSKLSPEGLKEVEQLLSDVDEDDDMTSEQIKGVKEALASYKQFVH